MSGEFPKEKMGSSGVLAWRASKYEAIPAYLVAEPLRTTAVSAVALALAATLTLTLTLTLVLRLESGLAFFGTG